MRTYEGLAADLQLALSLVDQLGRIVSHLAAAGVRADYAKPGVKADAVRTLREEFTAMIRCIPASERTAEDPITELVGGAVVVDFQELRR
jgi:hypothetical protein